jgi:multidrug efflux pump subunit AcrB
VASALWGLLVFGKPMSMPAIMGLILLGGTVVNNSILLLDFVRQARAEGADREAAIVEAVRLRLRPVLMTTLSTVLGLSPLVFEMAVGLERMSPLGIAAATGLLAGTVLTLLVLPVLFSLLDDLGQRVRRGRDSAAA